MSLDGKEGRFRAVAGAVIDILVQRGPAEIRIATVSRRSGVSRAWIYKQFGPETSALLDFAVREVGLAFAGIDGPRDRSGVDAWRASIAVATRKGLTDAVSAPWIPVLFFRYRHVPGTMGDAVRAIEERHLRAFVDDMPPALRPDPDGARAWASVFMAACLGTYAWWAGPGPRSSLDLETAADHLLAHVDAWIARCTAPR